MNQQKLVRLALLCGIAIPVFYFGIQFVAAPFYPDYSFVSMDASNLGSDGSSFPTIFNWAAIAKGFAAVFVAWGFFMELRQHKKRRSPYIVAFGLLCMAVGMINAGVFPLPHPNHTFGILAIIGIGMLILPIALPIAVWNLIQSRSIKLYLIGNLILMVLVSIIVSGLAQRMSVWTGTEIPGLQHFLNNYSGVLQRVTAAIIFVPLAACSFVLLRENSPESGTRKV